MTATPLARSWSGSAGSRSSAGPGPLREAVDDLAGRARLALPEAAPAPAGLTAREREVLSLLAEGRTNREIGQTLFISPKTASVHVSNLLTKLGAANRTEAASRARTLGLLAVEGARPRPRAGSG